MSRAGPSRPIKRTLSRPVPRQSPAKPAPKDDVIVISSDEDDEEESPKRPTASVNTARVGESPTRASLRASTTRANEPIIISSSESEALSKKHASSDSDKSAKSRPRLHPVVELTTPVNHRFKRTPASASSSKLRYTTVSSSQPRPALSGLKPFPLGRKTASVPTRLEDLPPLPPSSSPPQDHTRSSPTKDPTAYRESTAGPIPGSDGDVDSSSSGDMVETVLTAAERDPPPAMVLDSSPGPGSSGSDRGHDPTLPRDSGQPPIPSSPTPSQGSDRTEPEEELEEMTANVSLYDNLPNRGKAPDSAVAQAVAAVGNVNLGDGGVASGGSDELFHCSVGDCQANFTTAGQLRSHTSRDHGIKLQQKSKGKRKARDESAPVSSKRRLMDPPHPHSRDSSASGSSSDRFVKRKQTVGFNPFKQKVSDQESLSPSDVPDAASSSNSSRSPSPPSTPAPSMPKIRAPHPNMRTIVPDSPSQNLSPSKQIAQTKDSILIEGEKLETWRVDLVNSMPESYRRDVGCRAVFEAYMDDAMRENEPCAPAILVENEVDKEPCPPWEFVYYNRMVYGTNVPKPDMDALEGCDCLGPCNPSNKRCACVQRQERYFAENPGLDEYEGFGCHPSGEIKYHNGAIFGCNSKCSCDADCSNKVLQQGRKFAISIKKTKHKGWGVFAKENIPAGMFIGVYTGELLTEGIVNKRSPVYDEFGRTYVLNIDFAHIRANKDAPTYAVDAFHAGNFTRFFNHSCQPNMGLTAYYCEDIDIQKPLISLFSDRFIKSGEELTFSYTGLDVDDPDDVAKLQQIQHGENSGKVFEKCLCGAPKCFGIMFTGES